MPLNHVKSTLQASSHASSLAARSPCEAHRLNANNVNADKCFQAKWNGHSSTDFVTKVWIVILGIKKEEE